MHKNYKNFFSADKTVLLSKLKESFSSVLPVVIIVLALCFFFIPAPSGVLLSFILGALMLIIGMGLFTLGTDTAMSPIGESIGAEITRSKKLWLIIVSGLVFGTVITVSEPDLQVLADQVGSIPKSVLIYSISIGVGIFLVLALLRVFFKIKLSVLLIISYAVVFALSIFIPEEFVPVAFDSGGVTTGPMTVPFILALGVGVAATRSDRDAENDSFGFVALCSVGPILTVMLLGIFYHPDTVDGGVTEIVNSVDSKELWALFEVNFPKYFKEAAVSLLPVFGFFMLFQIFRLRMKKRALTKIIIGLVYTYLGIVIFLTGVNTGFLPMGIFLGEYIGGSGLSWLLVPFGMLAGYFIVSAEPAVHVLTKQVYNITSGAIPRKAMKLSLSIGVSLSVGLAMLRIILRIPIHWMLVPGYIIAIALSFFVPQIFTAIAFDSGGVASGPLTAAFLLPFAIGACAATGGNLATDAFGIVSMVAMTPLITIQLLGLYFRIITAKTKKATPETAIAEEKKASGEGIIEL